MARGTIRELLDSSSEAAPDAPAILDIDGVVTSYSQLLRNVDAISSAIVNAGVAPDRAVAVVLANGPLMATAFLGVSSAAVCAPLNPAYTEAELSFFYDDLDIAALVTDGVSPAAIDQAERRGLPVLREPFGPVSSVPSRSPDDVALVLHTSGTTARPKQVPLTHLNLCTSASSVADTLRLEPGDRCFNVMPLFHIHGIVAALLASLRAGGSVVCSPGFDATRFLPSVAQLEATWYTAVPTMHQAVLAAARRDKERAAACRLRFVRSSSAALPPAVMRDLEALFDTPVIEAYGMTEASHQMASNPLPPAVRKPGTVGVAAGSEIAIMTPDGQLSPAGVAGEIVIRGPAITAGYAADDSVNAAAFAHGWFHTGDEGVLDDDGYLTITGRLKEIINRGGEKISPREVEEVLLDHRGVAQAVVFAVPHPTLGEDVAAAVITADGEDLDAEDLRDFVAARLTAHKVPQRIVFRDALPLGPTGKLQRIGLAQRLGLLEARTASITDGHDEAPFSSLERAVAGVWAGLLGLDRVGREDRFIELGGDSLTAVTLAVDISETFGVDLPLTSPFEAGATVATMARLIETQRDGRPRRSELVPDPARTAVSFVQERFWVLHQLDPESGAYNVPLALRLRGPLDTEALRAALTEITRRHDALRSAFPAPDGEPKIVVSSPSPFPSPATDVAASANPLAAALDAAAIEARTPFDLSHGPLFRGSLYRIGADDHVLVLVMHHIVMDGWSRGLLRDELSSLYDAFSSHLPSPLPEIEFGYPTWAAAQRAQLASGDLNASTEYWRDRLDPAPPPVLLGADRPRRAHRDSHGSTISFSVDGPLRAALTDVARSRDATLFMTLLATFVGVLRRHTGLDDIVVGIPVAGRLDGRADNVIGPFLNTLPIRVALDGEPSFNVLLDRVRNACLEAYDHQQIPFEKIVDNAEIPRAADHAPLVQVLFQLRTPPSSTQLVGSLTAESLEVHTGAVKFDLSVEIDDCGDRLALRFEYATALFDAATIERLGRHFVNVARHASNDPAILVDEIDQLDDAERAALFVLATEGEDPAIEWTVPARVASVAESHSTRIAVRSSEQRLSYGELRDRVDELARRLRRIVAHENSFVGVCLPRSADLPVALLAVLRAGAAVVPLDPELPSARLAAVMEAANVEVVLTVGELTELLPPATRLVRLDDVQDPEVSAPDELPSVINADSVAYVMATSGSTGTPKCVLVQHRSLANFLAGFATRLGFDDGIRMLASTPISFDPFVRELFLPLVIGGEVVMTSHSIADDPLGVAAFVRNHEPSVVQGTPTTLRLLLDGGWVPSASVTVLSCGERLDEATAERLKRTAGRVWNLYGPTETTQCAVVHEVGESLDRIPVGRPLPGVLVEVVGSDLEPVPIGLPGEILIGGSGVARGYSGTTESEPDAFVTLARGRRYRTGDIGRWRNDECLEWLGRGDNQVKLNGVRIELGDAEAAFATYPGVRAAVVAVRDNRLVAWITVSTSVSGAKLRRHVADRLPAAMHPSAVVVLDEFPTLPNGKVDRNALVQPKNAPTGRGGPPQGDIEIRLAQVWASVLLAPDGIGRQDNFFEIGGNSLLAIQTAMAIEDQLGRHVPLTLFLTAPTLQQMAEALDDRQADDAATGVDPSRDGRSDSSLIQVRAGDATQPLLLWIPHATGTTLALRRLATLLPAHIELMGFEAPPHRGLPEPSTLSEWAAAYADDVRRLERLGIIGRDRPYALAGVSFGAVLAHEVACQLFDDCPPGAVLLVDPRIVEPPVPKPAVRVALSLRRKQRRADRWARRVRVRAARRLRPVRELLRRVRGQPPLPPVVPEVPLPPTVVQVEAMSARLRRAHRPQQYPGAIVVVTSDVRRRAFGDELIGLRPFVAGEISVHPLPGAHGGLIHDNRVHQVVAITEEIVNRLRPL